MNNLSNRIRMAIEQIEEVPVFSMEDVLPEGLTLKNYYTAAKALSQMVSSQKIVRVRKGLYFKPRESELLKIRFSEPSASDIVDYYAKQFNNCCYLTGPLLFNKMGLTEQVPVISTYAVNTPPKSFVELGVYFVKSKCPITQEDIKYLQLLDCIHAIDKIPGKDSGEAADLLVSEYLVKHSAQDLKRMFELSDFYNSRTKAVLSALLVSIGQSSMASEMRNKFSLSSNFKLYFKKSRTLYNAQAYGITQIN